MGLEPCFRNSGDELELLINERAELCWDQRTQKAFEGVWVRLLDLNKLGFGEGERLCLWLSQQYSFMPGGCSKAVLLPKRYQKSLFQDKVIIFGGSFTPWHEGHEACLSLCPDGPILVLPDKNPWKEVSRQGCPFEQFQQLAIKLEDTPHSLYPGFMILSEGNPTCHWIGKVNIPQKYLLVGDDTFLGFHQWRKPEEVLKAIQGFYVCPRQEPSKELECQRERLLQIKQGLEIVFLSHHDWEWVSSSSLRSQR